MSRVRMWDKSAKNEKNILPACVTSSQQGENRQCQRKAWIVSCYGPTYGTNYSAIIKQYKDIIAV